MDLPELREELLEHALEMLGTKYKTSKKFATIHLEHALASNAKIDNIQAHVPQMYTVEEAINTAKLMEMYVLGLMK